MEIKLETLITPLKYLFGFSSVMQNKGQNPKFLSQILCF